MAARELITKELASLFALFAHPHRIRIVEELRGGELDVNTLQQILGIGHSRVSQHLSQLRAHRLVEERRDGRHRIYRLTRPELASWLLGGLCFLETEASKTASIREACQEVRQLWTD